MKRYILCILCLCLLVGIFAGCGNEAPAQTTATTQATESPEEAEVLKIMILGSSRSVNAFQMLHTAFTDQMPDKKVVLGIMYHSGCSMSMHVDFMKNNEAAYDYYCNTDGRWKITKGVIMDVGLMDQAWDVVVLQAGNGDTENNMNENARKYITEYVDGCVQTPHTYWWHSTWFNSTDPVLYDNPVEASQVDQLAQLTQTNQTAIDTVLDDPMFAGHVTSGTPLMYALKELNIPEVQLYRDHTHLNDYGCLMIGYAWYAQFTGNAVTQINLDSVPSHLRHSSTQNLGDMAVTAEMKQAIIDTVKYTLDNPWAIPGKE